MQTQPQPPTAQPPASGPARRTRAATAHVQMPRELLRSPHHGALALVLWATYEDLMASGLGGERLPARMRRRKVGEAYGVGTSAVDAARRELLAETPGGPWLSRSAPRGAKRAVRHVALRRPRETGAAYVRVPQWSRDLVWGGRVRPAGRISPAAWRLYCRALERTGDDGGTLAASLRELGALLEASADTGRRRLAELEAAGLCAVTERPGDRLSVRVVVRQEEAAAAAARYAEHGRERQAPRQDPPRVVALTPRSGRQSPPAANGTPCDPPALGAACGETSGVPACDHVQVVGGDAGAADAGRQDRREKTGPTPKRRRRAVPGDRLAAAAAVYRALPAGLRARVPEHGSRRVLHAIAAELEHRDPAALVERIARRWERWRFVPETIEDATAVAMTVVRRGYDCPHVLCEDGTRIDTMAACAACEARPAATSSATAAAADDGQADAAGRAAAAPTWTPPPVAQARAAATPGAVAAPGADARRGAALARRLLAARSAQERAAILADAERAADDR